MKNIAIIGGGPAASATAISLLNELGEAKNKFTVSLYIRTNNQNCSIGETIPPAANQVLRELNIHHILESGKHHTCPGSLSVWGAEEPIANDFIFDLTGPGFHLDRPRFDNSLLHEVNIRGGKIIKNHNLKHVTQHINSVDLEFSTEYGNIIINADFVVDASGRSAAFARRLGIKRNVIDEVISVYTNISFAQQIFLPEHTLLEATADGWWYVSKVPNGQCVVSFTTDYIQIKKHKLSQVPNWLSALRETKWIKNFIPESAFNNCTLSQAPASSAILSACIGKQWLAVGDAASCYDSVTSAGITKSLMNGLLAGKALLKGTNSNKYLNHYQNAIFAQFNQYVGLHNHLYQMENRFHNFGFWQRRTGITSK